MAKLPKTVKAVNKVIASLKKKIKAMEKRKKMLAKKKLIILFLPLILVLRQNFFLNKEFPCRQSKQKQLLFPKIHKQKSSA